MLVVELYKGSVTQYCLWHS